MQDEDAAMRAGTAPAPSESHESTGLRRQGAALTDAIARNRVDIAIVASITVLAAVLRVWHLGTVPLGLHGDEAWTGLDARRVLHEGYIGPYLPSAVGQPIGPLYFTALLFKFMPDSTFTLRFSMALFGIATVPLAYLAFASMFNRTVAAFAALLLAVMMWHLHLSRTAFMVTAWPFIEMAVLLTLWQAMRRRSGLLFLVTGALIGLGVYTYNAYALFVPVPIVGLLWTYRPTSRLRANREWLLPLATIVLAALIVAIPMFVYVIRHNKTYRFHQKSVAMTYSQEWKDAGFGGKIDLVWDRAREWERGLITGNRPDLGDGLASARNPVIDPVTAFLAAIGLVMTLWRWKRPAYAVVIAAVLLLPLGALLTVLDGLYRRTFGLAPFVALLAALPLAWAWERVIVHARVQRYALAAIVLAVPAYVGVSTTYAYFGPVQDTSAMRFVYPYQIDAASHYMAGLPPGTYVYLYSFRWGFNYETRRFIAPSAIGEDRSYEFRAFGPGDQLDYSIDPGRSRVAFVFLDPYLDDIENVTRLHPGGTVTEGRRGSEVTFRAYEVGR